MNILRGLWCAFFHDRIREYDTSGSFNTEIVTCHKCERTYEALHPHGLNNVERPYRKTAGWENVL